MWVVCKLLLTAQTVFKYKIDCYYNITLNYNLHQGQNRTEQNTRRASTSVTHALGPHVILCAVLVLMHLTALHLEPSAVSC